mmetsp:Transcript_11407/g.29226  ORF Transcript_11407/g.29226 Transcript_11407/m.29226 type:complete len:89 (-) Transcript_11407:126-392(-)
MRAASYKLQSCYTLKSTSLHMSTRDLAAATQHTTKSSGTIQPQLSRLSIYNAQSGSQHFIETMAGASKISPREGTQVFYLGRVFSRTP